ncbi:MAG: hypothetical protein L6R48_10870 [Planctomycetes bacterium]|nr:hypothetical protein [Planctomycetota bacterium]
MKPQTYAIMQEVPGRWAAQVDACYQPNDPDQPGDVAMSGERAAEVAKTLAGRLGYDVASLGEPSAA